MRIAHLTGNTIHTKIRIQNQPERAIVLQSCIFVHKLCRKCYLNKQRPRTKKLHCYTVINKDTDNVMYKCTCKCSSLLTPSIKRNT